MSEISNSMIIKENSLQSLIYDQYVIPEFKEAISEKRSLIERVKTALSEVAENAEYNADLDTEEEKRWVVDMTEQQRKDLADNVLKLDKNEKGEFFAQFRRNGKYSNKIPIKEEIVSYGLTQGDVMLAMQLNVIEKRLDCMVDTLEDIQRDVGSVRKGQQNDRIGLYLSGMNLLLESKAIKDPVFQKHILAQAIRGLSDSNAQLIKEVLDDVEYLVTGQYKKSKYRQKEMDKRIENINKCFEIIHRSFVVKASAYYENNELQAMLSVIDEYCQFLSSAIVPYAGLLGEMDHGDHSLLNGRWEQRASVLSGMQDLREQLLDTSVYYLPFDEEVARID